MKFSGLVFFALAASAAAASSESSTLKKSACKSPKKSVSVGSASGVSVSKSAVSSKVASSVAPSGSAVSSKSSGNLIGTGISSKVASSKVSSGIRISSVASASASSGRPPVSSRVSSRVPSASASSGRRVSSSASSSRGSGSGGNGGSSGLGNGSSGLNGGTSCPAVTSTVTVGGGSGSTVTVTVGSGSGSSGSTVTVTVSGSGSGPSPTTQSACDPSASPLPPSTDPWYQAPAGYESASPGAVLKVRNACGLVPVVTNSSAAYQILYRTTNSLFNPTWAVTTILVPANVTGNNLLSYQYPYDSAYINASPSYALYGNGGLFGIAEITAALGRGTYVITPDYESWQASFVAGTVSGLATLDSLRAAIGPNSPVPSLSNATYALWGYSGGALASEWALEYQQQYAPELNIAAGALGGLTPNISQVLFTINKSVYVGLSFSGILGLSSQYSDLNDYVQAQLKQSGPYNATGFNAAKNYTLAQAIGAYAGQDISEYFTNGLDTLNAPVAQRVTGENAQGSHGIPKPPLFVYKAIGDDISPVNDTDALVNRYCAVGATIDYQRNTVGNHATELPNGSPRAVAFLNSIFAGTYSASGCQISNVSVSV